MRTRNCDRHGEYEYKEFVICGLKIELGCPSCMKEQEESEQREYQRKKETQRRQTLANLGIEPEFFTATLESYRAESESEKKALDSCYELSDGRIRKLLLLGSNGVGKTHLACSLAKELGGIRTTMFEISARIRASYNRGGSELDILDGLLRHDFIAIDELGRTKGSEAERNWLSYLIDKAHVRGIRLMLISNRHTARNLPRERQGEAIEFFFDNDVISRLRQDSRIVEIEGRDRRATVAV